MTLGVKSQAMPRKEIAPEQTPSDAGLVSTTDHLPRQPAEPSDESLVARIAQRDRNAFATIYDRYAHTIYTVAAYALGRAEAEDVVQDTFLRLWNKANQFDGTRGSFGAWFMTIARHCVLDELNRNSHRQRVVLSEEVEQVVMEPAQAMVDVEEQAWLLERAHALLSALQHLPAEQRQVLILAYFGGLSQSSIAQQLGWPLGTVKKRIRLGMQKLRAELAARGLVDETPTGSNRAHGE